MICAMTTEFRSLSWASMGDRKHDVCLMQPGSSTREFSVLVASRGHRPWAEGLRQRLRADVPSQCAWRSSGAAGVCLAALCLSGVVSGQSGPPWPSTGKAFHVSGVKDIRSMHSSPWSCCSAS